MPEHEPDATTDVSKKELGLNQTKETDGYFTLCPEGHVICNLSILVPNFRARPFHRLQYQRAYIKNSSIC